MELLLTKMEKTTGKKKLGFRGGLTFRLEHVKFNIFTRYPSGNVT